MRFVPQRKWLGYDNISLSKDVSYNVPIQQDHVCKETEGTSVVHPDKKMQNLYNKLQNMKGQGLTLLSKRIKNHSYLLILNTLMCLIVRSIDIVVCLDNYVLCVLKESTCGTMSLLIWKLVCRTFSTSLFVLNLIDPLRWYGSGSLKSKLDRGGRRCFMDYW